MGAILAQTPSWNLASNNQGSLMGVMGSALKGRNRDQHPHRFPVWLRCLILTSLLVPDGLRDLGFLENFKGSTPKILEPSEEPYLPTSKSGTACSK